MSPQARNL